MSTRRSVRAFTIAGAVVLALVAATLSPLTADAAVVAPTGLDYSAVGSDPNSMKFSWNTVAGASAYRVQIATENTFQSTSIVATQNTYALDWIPQAALATATPRALYWRVAAFATAQSDSSLGAYSDPVGISLGALNSPATTVPGSLDFGAPATVTYPTPVIFTWATVPGAVSYTVDYASGALGSNDGTTVSSSPLTTTTYAPVTPLDRTNTDGVPITWSWRVRANFYNGTTALTPQVPGPASATRYFTIAWPTAPTNLSPADGVSTLYSDVKFSWDAVPGAAKYRIDIGTQKTTGGAGVLAPTSSTVVGTVYVPTAALLDDSYFWQVTPLDVNNAAGTPSPVYQFKKAWGSQIGATTTDTSAVYPVPLTGSTSLASPPSVSLDDFQLSWQPMPRATLYNVQVFATSGLGSWTCRTASTSVTIVAAVGAGAQSPLKLVGSGACLYAASGSPQISAGSTYRWRVQAVDYTGSSATPLQNYNPTGTLVSEWSDPQAGDTSRARYIAVTAGSGGTSGPIAINSSDFTAANDDAHLGQPAPLFTWSPVSPPSGSTAQVFYEVRVYDNATRTSEVAWARTPSTRLRLTGVLDDNTTSTPYFASVRPYIIVSGVITFVGDESSQLFSWSKASNKLTIPADPVTVRTDGTNLLSWNPQFTTGSLDGGSRGYQINIAKGNVDLGSAEIEYPFYVAQNPLTGVPLGEGTYKYTVAPLDANGDPGQVSASTAFTIAAPVPSALGTSVVAATPALTWNSTTASAKYQLQYKLASAPSTSWTTVTALKQRAYVIPDLPAGQYLWKVASVDASNNVSGYSSDAGEPFTIGGGTVSTVTPDGVLLHVSGRILSWNSVPGASRYLVQIADNRSMTSPTNGGFETVTTSFVIPDTRIAGTTYYWKIQALPEFATTGSARPVLAESAVQTFTVVAMPSAPTINALVLNGSTLTASWALLVGAAAGTSGPVQYVVQYRVKSSSDDWSGATQFTTSAAATSYAATGLPNLTAYQFRLAALNSEGQGPWSAIKEATTASPPAAAPLNLRATAALGALAVSWSSVSTSGGLPLSGYVVRYKPSASGAWSSTTTTSASISLSGLIGATSYDIEVAAVNALGEGPAAALSTVTVDLPSAPLGFSVTRSDGAATVTWQAPATDGGAAVTSYRLEQSTYNATTKTWSSWTTSSVTTTSVLKTGLINGSPSQFRVKANTKFGAGAYAGPLTVTPAGKPLATTKFTVKPKKGTLSIAWAAAKNNGSAVIGYSVQYSTNKKKWTTLTNAKAKARSYTSKKGTKGKTYYFRVLAKNAVGTGAPSIVVQVKKI